jgi:hypothetical protein
LEQVIHTFQAKDGISVKVRPLQPEDAGHLVDIFENMSHESRYTRFNLPMTNTDPDEI